MIFLNFLRLFRGTVTFEAHGVFFEKFLSLCAQQEIPVFSPKRKDEVLTASVNASDYRKLKKPAKKAGLRLHIREKHGIPFFISRYHARLGIVFGIIAFLCILTILSNFLWSVKIIGIENASENEILAQLESLGLKTGRYIPSIDVRELEQRFLLQNDQISWIAININSSVAEIRVHERVDSPEFFLKDDTPCDIVACETGVIRYMEVYTGQPMVKSGDTVTEGELLISGITENSKGNTDFVHARGKVLASVWETATFDVNLTQTYRSDTGQKKTFYKVKIFGREIPLYFSENVSFDAYEETQDIPLSIFGFSLPISVERRTKIGYETLQEEWSEDAAKKRAFELWETYKHEHYRDSFIEKELPSGETENGIYRLTVQVTVKRNIAEEKEILFDTPLKP